MINGFSLSLSASPLILFSPLLRISGKKVAEERAVYILFKWRGTQRCVRIGMRGSNRWWTPTRNLNQRRGLKRARVLLCTVR